MSAPQVTSAVESGEWGGRIDVTGALCALSFDLKPCTEITFFCPVTQTTNVFNQNFMARLDRTEDKRQFSKTLWPPTINGKG